MSGVSHFSAAVLFSLTAATVAAADEGRPRIMHAEMVTAGDAKPARALKVADSAPPAAEAPAPKPRMFQMPLIDKSKAEDPYKNAPPPAPAPAPTKPSAAAPAPKPAAPASVAAAPAAPAPAARPVLKLPELSAAQELTRQQREMMLATSGPRKVAVKLKPEAEEKPKAHDYSHVHWSYSGLGAPENWGKLSGGTTCGTGKRQSPIDIRGGIRVDLEQIKFDYRPSQFRITDNGHTVQVDVAEGNNITVMGRSWQLVQFHFHRPSEERVNGKTFEMVAHLVHRDYANNLAVIAVLMDRGMEHPVIQTLWNHMPLDTGMSVEPPNVAIDLTRLLPERREYYTYMGSLTTPPCTENVLWMVFKEPIMVSPEQIGIFARLYPHNARPIQPTYDRLIKESR
jgi:carbonic anhydrase